MSATSNPHRSEAIVTVDGAPVTLRLTLAALAEIETALDASSLVDVAEKLTRPTAVQLAGVLRAMARAAGTDDLGLIEDGQICLREAMAAVTLLFREMLTGEAPGKPSPPPPAGVAG